MIQSPSPSPVSIRKAIVIDLTDSPDSPEVFYDAAAAAESPTPAVHIKEEEVEESVTESNAVESLQLGIENLTIASKGAVDDEDDGCVVA